MLALHRRRWARSYPTLAPVWHGSLAPDWSISQHRPISEQRCSPEYKSISPELHVKLGGGPRVVVSTAAFHARVRGSVPGLGGLKETKMFLSHPRVKVSIVGSPRDREVAYSTSDRISNPVSVLSQSFHHFQEVLLAQFSLYVHKGGLKPISFHLHVKLGRNYTLYPGLTKITGSNHWRGVKWDMSCVKLKHHRSVFNHTNGRWAETISDSIQINMRMLLRTWPWNTRMYIGSNQSCW